ncbi:hypothetical protein CEXT_494871 [Caerostris extrusa]|uniref:Uncharacterized protein n=1 Tax=Caerostris extrusa TaxID=172846 RepID=A0AAV4XBI1_CAEEX|nr:hypothetical protein CEXT_494871 [Caerostris extrusa]
MDLLRCEKCNCTITNFFNHRCLYREHSFDRIVSEMLDYNFGNISQEIPATISHSAEGADFNSSAFMNRTSTFQSSTFPQSANQERHWDVNSTAGTNVRYASSNTVQNENFDYFNSSQGIFFPATQNFENSDYTYGAENPAMAFSTAASTTTLNPFEQTCPNNSAWLQPDPNLSFYNQLPPNSQGLEDPPNYLTICDPTNKYCNVPINMQSRQSAMQNCEMQCFQDKDYDAVAIARKSDRTTKTTSWASDLNSTSINVQYPGNPYAEKPNHMATLQPVSTRTNTVMKEKFHNEFLNIQNSACRNIENSHSYTNPDFDQGLLGSQLDVNEISHYSYKSQAQFDDKNRFQNIFQCHFCGSYQIILNGQELPLNSSSVPFKCNVCIELMKLKEKIEPRVKIAKVCHERSANKLQKKMKVLDKRFSPLAKVQSSNWFLFLTYNITIFHS